MKSKNILLSVLCIFSILSCQKGDILEDVTLTIAAEKPLYDGGIFYSPYFAKTENWENWEFFSGIEGFNPEDGFQYVIRVSKEQWHNGEIQDASIYRYVLLEIISKTKKYSENLPDQHLYLSISSRSQLEMLPEIEGFQYEEGNEYFLHIIREYEGNGVFKCKLKEISETLPKKLGVLILTIAAEKTMYDGGFFHSPYFAKIGNSENWETFSGIEDFEHEDGFQYVIRVLKEQWHNGEIQDVSIYRYVLLETISKTKKYSKSLPDQHLYLSISSKSQLDDLPEIEGFQYEEGYEYYIHAIREYKGNGVFKCKLKEIIQKTRTSNRK